MERAREFTHVAPAVTNSTVLALVNPESTDMKLDVNSTMTIVRASSVVSDWHMIIGVMRSAVMKGIIRIRDTREVAALEKMCTWGSLDIMPEEPLSRSLSSWVRRRRRVIRRTQIRPLSTNASSRSTALSSR